MNKQLKIACIGEAMVELSLDNEANIALGFAGDTLNTAIYLKRLLGNTAMVGYCTALGHDPLSRKLKEFIASESITTDHINHSDTKTVGLYAIATDSAGERSFSYWRSDSAARTLFQTDTGTDFNMLDEFDVLYLSAITLAILPDTVRTKLHDYLTERRNKNSIRFAFDSNYRPALWESQNIAQETVASFWEITDIALPSVDDEMDLYNETSEKQVLERFKKYQVKSGALKRGKEGPMSLTSESLIVEYPPVSKVIDSTAAGDSFNAGYLSAALTNQSEEAAMLAGHNCACRVISHRGAIIPLEDW